MRKRDKSKVISYYKYKPSILRPLYVNFERLSLKRRVRLFLAYFSGYVVYYMLQGEEYIGYCLVQRGSDKRYKFAKASDIIVGPYYIAEKYRGKKLSITLLKYILGSTDLNFNHAYDYIHKDNIPSIKASEAVGFQFFSYARISKLTRRIDLCEDDSGDYLVFKYSAPSN